MKLGTGLKLDGYFSAEKGGLCSLSGRHCLQMFDDSFIGTLPVWEVTVGAILYPIVEHFGITGTVGAVERTETEKT
jgi:hypothetical protein